MLPTDDTTDLTGRARESVQDVVFSLRENTDTSAPGQFSDLRPLIEQAHREAASLASGGEPLTPQAEAVVTAATTFHCRQVEENPTHLADAAALPLYTFEEVLRHVAHENGVRFERRVLPPGGCCEECQAHARKGWVPVGSLPELFDSECLTGCECHFEFSDTRHPMPPLLNGQGGRGGDAEFGILPILAGAAGVIAGNALVHAIRKSPAINKGVDVVGRHLMRLGRRAGVVPNANVDEKSGGKWYEVGADGPDEQHSDQPESKGTPSAIKSGPRKGSPCLRDEKGHIIAGRPGIVGGNAPHHLAEARDVFSPVGTAGGRVPEMLQEDGSIYVGGGKALVHVNEHGEIDHGPAHLRGRRVDVNADGGPKVDSGEVMKDVGLKGNAYHVADAYAAEKAFAHNAPKEIDHIRQSLARASGDTTAENERHGDAVANHLTMTMRSLLARQSGDADRPAAAVNAVLGHYDPRDILMANAPAAPGVMHRDNPDTREGRMGLAEIPGKQHRSVLSPDAAVVPHLWAPSLRSIQSARVRSDEGMRASSRIYGVKQRGPHNTEHDFTDVRRAMRRMSDAEAAHIGERSTGVLDLSGHTADSAADKVVKHLKQVTGYDDRERAGIAGQQVREGSSYHGTTEQRQDQAGRMMNHLGLLAHQQQLTPQHLTTAAAGLRKGFSLENLRALHRTVHGTDAMGPSKDHVIRSLLGRHARAGGLPAEFAIPGPSIGELLVNWNGEIVTQEVAAFHMAEEGLSDEAIDLVLASCEVAEEEENDLLVPAVCMALSMRVQSILFPTDKYTADQAVAWAKDHDYQHGKVDTTDNFHRLRQFDPGECKGEPRTIAFKKAKGVKAVVCPMKAKDDTVENADAIAVTAPEEVELVWCDGQVWDTTSVLLSMLNAGLDEWQATRFLDSYERASFATDANVYKDAKTGRPFIWRSIGHAHVMIYTDGDPDKPAIGGPPGLVARLTAQHPGIAQAAQEAQGKSHAEKIGHIDKAVKQAHGDAIAAKKAGKAAKQSRQAFRGEARASGLTGARAAVGRVAAAGLKKLSDRTRQLVGSPLAAAIQSGKKLGAGAQQQLLKARVAARNKAKALGGAIKEGAQKAGEDLRTLGYHHKVKGGGAYGAKKIAETATAWVANKTGASGTLLGQALAEGYKKANQQVRRGMPVRKKGESKEDYKARAEIHKATLAPKLKAFKAARINSMRESLKKGGLQLGTRFKVAMHDLKAKLLKPRNADGTLKPRGVVSKAFGLAAKAVGSGMKLYGFMGNVQKHAGEAIERKIKEKYPGMAGKAAIAVGRTLNRAYTAHGLLAALGTAGVAAGALAAGHIGLATGIAALSAGMATKSLLTAHSNRKWLIHGAIATAMGAGKMVKDVLSSLVSRKKATMSWDGVPLSDNAFFDDDDQDWGEDIDPNDLPDDFDWNVVSQMAVEAVNESLHKMGQWMHDHRQEMADVDQGFGDVDPSDAGGDPSEWAKDVPNPTFSCEGLESLPLPGLDAVTRRAEFLRGTPYAEFARQEAIVLFDAVDAYHGHGACKVALLSAALTPLPGAPAVEAALCDLAQTYEGAPLGEEPLDVSYEEAAGLGTYLALALGAGWRR